MDHAFAITPRTARARTILVSMSALASLLTLLLALGAPPAAVAAPLRTFEPHAATALPQAAEQHVVLAQNDGLMLVGRLSALRGNGAPELEDVDEAAAAGGGPQLFAPKASIYPPPAYDPAVTTIICELRWEKAALDAIDW